jgi:hypothetical protein
MAKIWQLTPERFNQLFAELGRCLYVYQALEIQLKLLLPHIVIPSTNSHASDEGFSNWRVFLDSKETMGPLMQRLKDRIVTNSREQLDAAWTQIVNHRNEVVHHFASQQFASLTSEDEFKAAMRFLQHRRKFAVPMLQALQQMSSTLIEALNSVESADAPDIVH